MNMNKSELRQAVQKKLAERRALMGANRELRGQLRHADERIAFLKKVMNHPFVERLAEDMADAIVQALFQEAEKASRFVVEQTVDTGDYEFGISIPSLHIRHRVVRMEFEDMRYERGEGRAEQPQFQHLRYDGGSV